MIIKPLYSPAFLALGLDKTLNFYKTKIEEAEFESETNQKITWAKETSDKIISVIEKEVTLYNKLYPNNKVKGTDVQELLEGTLNRLKLALEKHKKKA